MEELNWRSRSGFLVLDERALWYEFFCDAVSIPIEVYLGMPRHLETERFVRVLRVPFESTGAKLYFSGIDSDKPSEERSFTLPFGRYDLFALAYNAGEALDSLDVPEEYEHRFEHHSFYFAPHKNA